MSYFKPFFHYPALLVTATMLSNFWTPAQALNSPAGITFHEDTFFGTTLRLTSAESALLHATLPEQKTYWGFKNETSREANRLAQIARTCATVAPTVKSHAVCILEKTLPSAEAASRVVHLYRDSGIALYLRRDSNQVPEVWRENHFELLPWKTEEIREIDLLVTSLKPRLNFLRKLQSVVKTNSLPAKKVAAAQYFREHNLIAVLPAEVSAPVGPSLEQAIQSGSYGSFLLHELSHAWDASHGTDATWNREETWYSQTHGFAQTKSSLCQGIPGYSEGGVIEAFAYAVQSYPTSHLRRSCPSAFVWLKNHFFGNNRPGAIGAMETIAKLPVIQSLADSEKVKTIALSPRLLLNQFRLQIAPFQTQIQNRQDWPVFFKAEALQETYLWEKSLQSMVELASLPIVRVQEACPELTGFSVVTRAATRTRNECIREFAQAALQSSVFESSVLKELRIKTVEAFVRKHSN